MKFKKRISVLLMFSPVILMAPQSVSIPQPLSLHFTSGSFIIDSNVAFEV